MSYEYYITPEEYKVAEKNGIKPQQVDDRVRGLGWRKKDAITKPPMIVNCAERNRWAEIAKKNEINRDTFFRRLYAGKSHEEAATSPMLTRSECVAAANSKKRRIFTDKELKMAENNGISRSALYTRVGKLGWSKEKALSTPTMTKKECGKAGRAAYEKEYGNLYKSIFK